MRLRDLRNGDPQGAIHFIRAFVPKELSEALVPILETAKLKRAQNRPPKRSTRVQEMLMAARAHQLEHSDAIVREILNEAEHASSGRRKELLAAARGLKADSKLNVNTTVAKEFRRSVRTVQNAKAKHRK